MSTHTAYRTADRRSRAGRLTTPTSAPPCDAAAPTPGPDTGQVFGTGHGNASAAGSAGLLRQGRLRRERTEGAIGLACGSRGFVDKVRQRFSGAAQRLQLSVQAAQPGPHGRQQLGAAGSSGASPVAHGSRYAMSSVDSPAARRCSDGSALRYAPLLLDLHTGGPSAATGGDVVVIEQGRINTVHSFFD